MTDVIHRAVPTLPIKNSVLFPYLIMPLAVGRPRSVAAVEAALAKEDKLIAVFAQKGPSIEEPSLDDCYSIGTLGVIKKMGRAEDMLQVVVQGMQCMVTIDAGSARPFVRLT